MNQNCPQRQELVDYLLGKLPEDLLQQLEQHFVDCSSCEETLRGLNVADTLNNWVEQAARDAVATRPSEDSEEQFVANLISRMQGQSSAIRNSTRWHENVLRKSFVCSRSTTQMNVWVDWGNTNSNL